MHPKKQFNINIEFHMLLLKAGKKSVSMSAPTGIHKRKHQLSFLAFQAKQMEHDIQAKRARSMLTKSQTQAKYGW